MSGEQYNTDYMNSEFYSDSAYTADISTRMRVPDRLMAHNGNGADEELRWPSSENNSDPRWTETNSVYSLSSMQVPDRILLAGSDHHVSSKSTPRELQLEKHIMPPTPEHVRVHTPPRSIRLDDVPFPSAAESPMASTPPKPSFMKVRNNFKERTPNYDADLSLSQGSEANISLYDEVQRMRTQLAKLNHRLMAAEMEVQQQNQRWQVCSVLVSAYFLVKTMIWINKN